MPDAEIPINVVGSSVFGRYPKIDIEKTYNMFESDGWLVNYAGYKKIATIGGTGTVSGRGIFHSIRGNFMLQVSGSTVYRIEPGLGYRPVGNLATATGEVHMDENLTSQICIVDGVYAYIYNRDDDTLTQQSSSAVPFPPNYVCYHNTFFLLSSAPSATDPQKWYAYLYATASTIAKNTVGGEFTLQTKPDRALAVVRIPGAGNNVLVLGSAVSEIWTQVGGTENYRRMQSFNIDYGCVSVDTIAALDKYIFWLSQNENSEPVIMAMAGGQAQEISTSGINYLLRSLSHPEQSTAFFYRQDGNLFYQITFWHPDDNLTVFYHVQGQKFYHASDEKQNYYPARQVIYFNKGVYFVSLNDGDLYQMSTDYFDYNYVVGATDGEIIPRMRMTATQRQNDATYVRINEFSLTMEQGYNNEYLDTSQTDKLPVVHFSMSKNGGASFSNILSLPLFVNGKYRNRVTVQRLGIANEFTVQLRFWGRQRFVVNNAVIKVG